MSGDLDREISDRHRVFIYCQDQAKIPLYANATFDVEVGDENDKSPVFSSKVYKTHIEENIGAGHVIVHVGAMDGDIGINAEIRYSIDQINMDKFNIDSVTGVIRNNVSFDREVTAYLELKVYATDSGDNPRTGTATVSLIIDDVNDESPTFERAAFVFEIAENEYADAIVAQLNATDRDKGDNGEVVFSLTPGQAQVIPFIVFPTGLIKTDRELDREVQSIYDFSVDATDLGFPSRNRTARVTVFVTDKNDNVPVITAPSSTNNSMQLSTNTSPGAIVTYIRAFDLDHSENAMIRYYVVNRNGSDLFDLDEMSGILTLRNDISKMNGQTVTLELEAIDMGRPRLYTRRTLTIRITSDMSPASATQNFIIVIVLVVVTAICSTGILVVICVLRRSDSRRNKKHKDRKELTKDTGGFGQSHGVVYSLPNDDMMVGDKKKKKEVSFSLEDEDHMLQIANPTHLSTLQNNNLLQKPYDVSGNFNLNFDGIT